jgi:hypothetical protein
MAKRSAKARININLTKVNTQPVYRPVKTTYNHAQFTLKLKGLYETTYDKIIRYNFIYCFYHSICFKGYTSQARQLSTMKTVMEKALISYQGCAKNGRVLLSCPHI